MPADPVPLVYIAALNLWSCSLCNAGYTRRLHDVIARCRVGDLVAETSTAHASTGDLGARIGYLRAIGEHGDAWTIDRLDGGGEVTWRNASFVRVLTERFVDG